MCNNNIFRTLDASEIEVRVQQTVESNGKIKAVLLLYKNARVDMDMLDETFGCMGWQREHSFKEGKNYCKVSVYDQSLQHWVSKEDVGVESNTEETKGEASDAFKRACVNLGIGRELYSAPTIIIELRDNEWRMNQKTGKPQVNSWTKFRVDAITYNAKNKIIGLSIADSNGHIRYMMGGSQAKPLPQPNREKKTLTMDDIMDEAKLTKLCEWLKRNAKDKTIEDALKMHFIVDAEVVNCVTNEYLRAYVN